MKRAMILAGLAALLLAAATVWWLKGRSLEVRVTEPQLRAQLAERFPVERTVLLLLRWRLTAPSLAFLPQRQRVAVGVDARLNLKLEGGRSDLGGRIELETGVRYDEARGALFLVDPVITRLVVDGREEFVPVAPTRWVAEPTGAGDAYRAGLMRGMQLGLPWGIAGRMGALAAAYVLEQFGPQNHYFTREEFVARYRESFDDEGALDVLLQEPETIKTSAPVVH